MEKNVGENTSKTSRGGIKNNYYLQAYNQEGITGWNVMSTTQYWEGYETGRPSTPERVGRFSFGAPDEEDFKYNRYPGHLILRWGGWLKSKHQHLGIHSSYLREFRKTLDQIRPALKTDPILATGILHIPTLVHVAQALALSEDIDRIKALQLIRSLKEKIFINGQWQERPEYAFNTMPQDKDGIIKAVKKDQFTLRDLLVEFYTSARWRNADQKVRKRHLEIWRQTPLVRSFINYFNAADFDISIGMDAGVPGLLVYVFLKINKRPIKYRSQWK